MSRLSRAAWNVILVALVGFIICTFCFIHTQKIKHNHQDVLSGYGNETCVTVGHDLDKKGGYWTQGKILKFYIKKTCRVYAVDSCERDNKIYRELTDKKIDCETALVNDFFAQSPIGSLHLYYYFNRRPDRYFTPSQQEDFIKKYTRDPKVDEIVLSSFTGAFFLAILICIVYLTLRDWQCTTGETTRVHNTPTPYPDTEAIEMHSETEESQ